MFQFNHSPYRVQIIRFNNTLPWFTKQEQQTSIHTFTSIHIYIHTMLTKKTCISQLKHLKTQPKLCPNNGQVKCDTSDSTTLFFMSANIHNTIVIVYHIISCHVLLSSNTASLYLHLESFHQEKWQTCQSYQEPAEMPQRPSRVGSVTRRSARWGLSLQHERTWEERRSTRNWMGDVGWMDGWVWCVRVLLK